MTNFLKELKDCGFIVGGMGYLDTYPGETKSPKIVLSVQLENSAPLPAIMDTGAPWCIFDPELISFLDIDKESGYRPEEGLNIRGVTHHGILIRAPITLLADEGEDLTIEATIFIPDWESDNFWHYPNFIGLDGCLSRMRFAVDPSKNMFYFGSI